MTPFTLSNKKIYVSGHSGLAGSAILRALKSKGEVQCVVRDSDVLDLRKQSDVNEFFRQERPDVVLIAAATAGGIHANYSRPYDFIYNNLMITANLISASVANGVERVINLGSSCIYPRDCSQPMREESLLSGPLDTHNIWYAVSKIAGIYLGDGARRQFGTDVISLMPSNLYGPGDKFTPENSHVVAALIDRFHNAKLAGDSVVKVWGTGSPRREFLHCDDFASATLFLAENYFGDKIVNVGCGFDYSISELAMLVAEVVGFDGKIKFDKSKPDGVPRKCVDISYLDELGWKPSIPFKLGLKQTYNWYLSEIA